MERQICTQCSSQTWILMWSSKVLGWVRETLSIKRYSGVIREGTKHQYSPPVGMCIARETGFSRSGGTSSFLWSMQTSETGPNLQILGMGHQRHGKFLITRNWAPSSWKTHLWEQMFASDERNFTLGWSLFGRQLWGIVDHHNKDSNS